MSRQTLNYLPHPFYGAKGDGCRLVDVDGNQYLDFVNNYTSLIHGHGHQPTNDAAIAAVEKGAPLGAPAAAEAELARTLRERVPSLERVRFTTTGSEAVAFALRVARNATGRQRILKFEGGFHGSYTEVQQDIWNEALEPGAAVPARPSSAGLDSVSTITAVYNDVDSVRHAFGRWGGEIAAVVVEPFLGNAALISATEEFLAAVVEQARGAGALVVLDEIQSLRLAPGGVQSVLTIEPDLTVVGKIIGGGFPLAAFGGRAELMAAVEGEHAPVPQTGTFTGLPAALAAGAASLTHFGAAECERLNVLGARLRAHLRNEFARAGIPVQVNGDGSMFHICVLDRPVRRYRDFRACDQQTWAGIRLGLLCHGIYVMSRGTGCLSTPMDDGVLDEFAAALRTVLRGAG